MGDKIAAIKLVSGEEIVCTLVKLEDDSGYTVLSFKDPVRVVLRDRRKPKKYSLEPWLCIKNDTIHVIDVTKILTVYEISDVDILNDYSAFFKRKLKLFSKPNRYNDSNSKIGYIGNVNDFKNTLEKLYKDIDSYEKP
jgi:hypothetical protein